MKVLMFSYGPDVDPAVLSEEVDEEWILERRPGKVDGFRLVFESGDRDQPASLETEEGAILEGALYELKPPAYKVLDDLYGYPGDSDRLVVTVESEGEEVENVRMYLPIDRDSENSPAPSRNEIEIMIAGGTDVFSTAYSRWLERELDQD